MAFLPSSLPVSCCQTLFLCSHCCWSELLNSYSSHVDNNFQGLWSQHTLNKILELECCFDLVFRNNSWGFFFLLFFFLLSFLLLLFVSFSSGCLFVCFGLGFWCGFILGGGGFFSLDKQMWIKAQQILAQISKIQSLVPGHKQVTLLASGRHCTCLCRRWHSSAVFSGQFLSLSWFLMCWSLEERYCHPHGRWGIWSYSFPGGISSRRAWVHRGVACNECHSRC